MPTIRESKRKQRNNPSSLQDRTPAQPAGHGKDESRVQAAIVQVIDAEIVPSQLQNLESQIEQGQELRKQGEHQIWLAAAEILEQKLFLEAGFESFQDYCRDRWQWEKTNAYDYAKAGNVLQSFRNSGIDQEQLPTSVSQALQLAKLPPAERVEVVETVLELSGKLTAEAIKQVIEDRQSPPLQIDDPYKFTAIDPRPVRWGEVERMAIARNQKGFIRIAYEGTESDVPESAIAWLDVQYPSPDKVVPFAYDPKPTESPSQPSEDDEQPASSEENDDFIIEHEEEDSKGILEGEVVESAIASATVADSQPDPDLFTPDDWETPDWLARLMASLILPSDERILEPAAGRGAIAKHLPEGARVTCCEIKAGRSQEILKNASNLVWNKTSFLYTDDFLGAIVELLQWRGEFDVVITNPPFSKASEFIAQGLKVLNRKNVNARLLYLLPSDFFQSVARNKAFLELDAHIHHEYKIVNRVAYIREGQPMNSRQIYDTLYDIRPGKAGGSITFWNTQPPF